MARKIIIFPFCSNFLFLFPFFCPIIFHLFFPFFRKKQIAEVLEFEVVVLEFSSNSACGSHKARVLNAWGWVVAAVVGFVVVASINQERISHHIPPCNLRMCTC